MPKNAAPGRECFEKSGRASAIGRGRQFPALSEQRDDASDRENQVQTLYLHRGKWQAALPALAGKCKPKPSEGVWGAAP